MHSNHLRSTAHLTTRFLLAPVLRVPVRMHSFLEASSKSLSPERSATPSKFASPTHTSPPQFETWILIQFSMPYMNRCKRRRTRVTVLNRCVTSPTKGVERVASLLELIESSKEKLEEVTEGSRAVEPAERRPARQRRRRTRWLATRAVGSGFRRRGKQSALNISTAKSIPTSQVSSPPSLLIKFRLTEPLRTGHRLPARTVRLADVVKSPETSLIKHEI